MNAYYLTNEIAVDSDSEETLISNDRTGDAEVTLCCASGMGEYAGSTLYYLRTNGDPVMLPNCDDDPVGVADWVETLGCDADAIISAIHESDKGVSAAWAAEQIEQSKKNEVS